MIEQEVRLVIVDPLLGYLPSSIDSHKDQSIREALHAVKLMAERSGAAVLAVRHLTKHGSGPAIMRGGGSVAIVAAARSALIYGRHPSEDGVYVVAVSKCNLAPKPLAVAYRVGTAGGQPVAEWVREEPIAADELATPEPGTRGEKQTDAVLWLRGALRSGPVSAKKVLAAGLSVGFSDATIRRAKAKVGVKVQKGGFDDGWDWALPPTELPEDAQP